MVRKLIAAAALAGAAILILPTLTTSSFAQGGTLGAGAARTGAGPGTNAGDPNLSNKTGPGANPIAGGNGQAMQHVRKRHVARHHSRRMRSTVGSSGRTGAPGAGTVQGPVTQGR